MRKKSSLLIFCLLYFFSVNAQWSLTGNAISTGNFLGTTNAQNLIFQAYSTPSGFIDINYHNTAFGLSSGGSINSTAQYNCSFGNFALQHNSTGYANVAFGYLSLPQNSSGATNTAVGAETMYDNTTGAVNSAVGALALYHNTTGNSNNAFGADALVFNTIGQYNNAFGAYSLYSNINGNDNCAMGYQSLYTNTSGSDNVAIGEQSLYSNTTGGSNIAIGNTALYSNTTGSSNIGIGWESLKSNVSGNYNTAVGLNSLQFNNGSSNSAYGISSLAVNTGGSYNTAIGTQAMQDNTTGNNNVAVGGSAGGANTTGSYNVWIGDASSSSATNLTNSIAIGYEARTFANNQAVIGNTSVTSIGGYATSGWTIFPSDRRFKKNVKENVPGLAFIKQLRPITYNVDVSGLNNFLKAGKGKNNAPSATEQATINQKESIVCSGFIAQEVEAAAKKIGYEFSGVDAPKDANGLYGLGYAEFVVPLVKAVQELSNTHDSLKNVTTSLQSQINDIQEQINKLKNVNETNVFVNGALLRQNAPNPFNSNTKISYFIPAKATSSLLQISNVNGQLLKTVNISSTGEGLITLNAGELASGTYFYSLIVDGIKIDTKKMVLTK